MLNPADYDYMDNTSVEGFMWEFIRRNQHYRNIFRGGCISENLTEFFHVLKALRTFFPIKPVHGPCNKINKTHFFKFIVVVVTFVIHS